MIHYNIYFAPYDWDIEIYIIFKDGYVKNIINELEDCDQYEIQRAVLNLTTRINSGFTRTIDNKSLIVINQPTTLEEFVNVYNHEKNHLEMHICEKYGIDPHSEKAAVLSGKLAQCLFSSLIDQIINYYLQPNNN